MRRVHRLGLITLCLFLFQNCGSIEAYDMEMLYTYQDKPVFFYDLKLVRVETDEFDRETFEFDLVVSYASDSSQPLTVHLAYSTLARSSSCPTVETVVEGQTKHQRFVCKIPIADDLYVQLTMIGPNEEEEVKQFRF